MRVTLSLEANGHDVARATTVPTVETGPMSHRVVGVALLDGARVLLGHRSSTRSWNPNVGDLSGGHVEEGELPAAAPAREVREELGAEIAFESEVPVLRLAEATSELELTVLATRTWRGVVRNTQSREYEGLGWFTPEECEGLDLADEAYRPFLRRLLGDATPSAP